MNASFQIKENLLREVARNTDPQGFCILWDDCDEKKEHAINRLIHDEFLRRTSFSCDEECRLEITSRGEQELAQIDQAAASAKPLTIFINWFGALSRLLIAALAFVAGFLADNLSPRLYCIYLPNSGVGILAPCELPDEGKTK